jgi:hypothetical protein
MAPCFGSSFARSPAPGNPTSPRRGDPLSPARPGYREGLEWRHLPTETVNGGRPVLPERISAANQQHNLQDGSETLSRSAAPLDGRIGLCRPGTIRRKSSVPAVARRSQTDCLYIAKSTGRKCAPPPTASQSW